jgi:hypothetical protein
MMRMRMCENVRLSDEGCEMMGLVMWDEGMRGCGDDGMKGRGDKGMSG